MRFRPPAPRPLFAMISGCFITVLRVPAVRGASLCCALSCRNRLSPDTPTPTPNTQHHDATMCPASVLSTGSDKADAGGSSKGNKAGGDAAAAAGGSKAAGGGAGSLLEDTLKCVICFNLCERPVTVRREGWKGGGTQTGTQGGRARERATARHPTLPPAHHTLNTQPHQSQPPSRPRSRPASTTSASRASSAGSARARRRAPRAARPSPPSLRTTRASTRC